MGFPAAGVRLAAGALNIGHSYCNSARACARCAVTASPIRSRRARSEPRNATFAGPSRSLPTCARRGLLMENHGMGTGAADDLVPFRGAGR
jgi:hypothetical protein